MELILSASEKKTKKAKAEIEHFSQEIPCHRPSFSFFKLNQIVDGIFQLYISVSVLEYLQIPTKTIRNGISLSRIGKSKNWISFSFSEKLWVRFDSIPSNTIRRHNLPHDSQTMYEKLKSWGHAEEQFYKDVEFVEIYNSLENAYLNAFPSHLNDAKKYYTNDNDRIRYSKNAALIMEVIRLAKNKSLPPEGIFSCYRKLAVKEIENLNGLVFVTQSSKSFWRKIKQVESEGVMNALVHRSKGILKPDRRKGNEAIDAYIRVLLRKPAQLTLIKILKRTNIRYKVNLSLSYVKKIAAARSTKNLTDFDANGYFHSRTNSLPKLKRMVATKPGELFQGDFYQQQFVVRRRDGNIGAPVSYFVLDVYSRKIVGWAVGSQVDEHIALNAFKNAFISCGFLPESISVDGDLYYRRPDFKSFVKAIQDLGVIWLAGDPYKPTVRAEIESFFSKYQKVYCSDKKFFMGEGVKSKNKRGNPSEELTRAYWKIKNELPTESELEIEIRKMIRCYNYQIDEESEYTSDNEV